MCLINDSQKQELTKLGQVLFTPYQCEIVMELKGLEVAIGRTDSEAYKAYQKGKLLTLFESRMNTITMAKNGSAPAQAALEKLTKEIELHEIAKA